jgi:hypothetical protein
MTCEYCHLVIAPGENTAQFKKPGTREYFFFHRRENKDCYWKFLRDRILKAPGKPRTSPHEIQAT